VWCAAGNAGKTHNIFYPAAYKETIGIGAIDKNFERAGFSCTGPDLDFLAPGVGILSTVPKNWYAVLSGTSMANPFAVGLGCLLLSYKREKSLSIKLDSSHDYIDFLKGHTIFKGNHLFEGFGIIDPRKMQEWISSIS
jgi:subtilisin family serine protease